MASPSPPKRSDTTSSSSRPSSPSPARSMRNRMTSAMRRASTGLAFGTKIPTISRQSSKNSLKVDPAQAPTTSETHLAPSPVVETAEESPSFSAPLGPSPLQNSTGAPEDTSEPAPRIEVIPEPQPEPAPAPAPAEVSAPPEPQVQVTESPVQLPSPPQAAPTPAPAPAPEPQPFGFSDAVPTTQVPAVVESPVIAPSDAAPVVVEAPAPPMPEPTPAAPLPPPVEAAARPVLEDHRADYFSFRDPVVPAVAEAKVEEPRAAAPEAPVAAAPQVFPVAEPAQYQGPSHVQIPTDDSTFAWSDEPALGHKRTGSSLSDPPQPSGQHSGKVSTQASKSSLASSYGNVIPPANTAEQRRGRSSSVR
ncbi:hypothetical protein C8Q77DRAFT_444348 [Trametes polyzona]|nr:hypothetical protein C8Q77DRAFT_444348 [Trametes polyzona]